MFWQASQLHFSVSQIGGGVGSGVGVSVGRGGLVGSGVGVGGTGVGVGSGHFPHESLSWFLTWLNAPIKLKYSDCGFF